MGFRCVQKSITLSGQNAYTVTKCNSMGRNVWLMLTNLLLCLSMSTSLVKQRNIGIRMKDSKGYVP